MLFLHLLLAFGFLFSYSSALFPSNQRPTSRSATPLPPSKDPFYTAPANYESSAPGTILRIRIAPGNLSSITPNCSVVYNIVYRTTDSRYHPSWAVTTLFIPRPLLKARSSTALLSYQIPYNTRDVDASPSYSLYSEIAGFPDIPSALGRGWLVNVPDFEGPLASMAAGVQEGHATLDSVRAVLSSAPRFGLAPNARYAMWGYSGGSVASEWAAELQQQYAPELSFAGMAIGGMVVNVSSTVYTVTSGFYAGLIPGGLLGITRQFPEAYDFLVSKLKTSGPYNSTTFLSVEKMDILTTLAAFANQDIFNYFVDSSSAIEDPKLQHVFNSNGMMGYHGIPQMPIFAYKAIKDQVSVVAETDKLVERYCGVGVNILYQRNELGGHYAEESNGDERAVEWLGSVLDGTYGEKFTEVGCTVQNVSVGVDSPA